MINATKGTEQRQSRGEEDQGGREGHQEDRRKDKHVPVSEGMRTSRQCNNHFLFRIHHSASLPLACPALLTDEYVLSYRFDRKVLRKPRAVHGVPACRQAGRSTM